MAHRPFGDFSQQQDRPPSDLHRDIFDTRLDPRVPTQDQEVSISSTYFYTDSYKKLDCYRNETISPCL